MKISFCYRFLPSLTDRCEAVELTWIGAKILNFPKVMDGGSICEP